MAQRYKFFNSGVNDPRKYQASDFADYFGSVLSTGLLHTDEVPGMSVSVEAGTLNTIVSPGKAIMKGYLYENTSPLTLEHSVPEPTLDRIDRIVLRLDLRNSERNILLHVKEGMPAENPVPPELQRDNLIHEISLAQIRVRADTVQLLPSDLVDERLDEELCGLVNSLLTVPTSQFQAQWDAFFNDKQDEVNQAVDDYLQALLDAEQALQDDIDAFEQQWNDWFSQQQTEGFVLQSEKGQPGGIAKQDDFAAHLADGTAHGIGDKTLLETTEKETIVGAVNELFTNVSNGKTILETAITDKGGKVSKGGDIPTFNELKTGILSIPIGIKLKTVQSGSTRLTLGDYSKEVNIEPVNIEKAFLIFNWGTSARDNLEGAFVRVNLSENGTQIEFRRRSYSGTIDVNWFVVEFESGVKVQHLSGTAISEVKIEPVNIEKSFIISSHIPDSSASRLNDYIAGFAFINNETIKISDHVETRPNWSVQVVELLY